MTDDSGSVRYARVEATGIDVAYETFGAAGATPVVLVMGLGTQMIAWPDELCRTLAQRGMFVIRHDNRDIGLSTHLDGIRAPSPQAVLFCRARPPYLVEDMALDTLGLLDALGLLSAHLVGASMGGFISQTVAIKAPLRVRSLTLMMTSTGSLRVGRPHARTILAAVRRPRPANVEEAVDTVVETFRRIGSPGYPFDEPHVRDLARRSLARSNDQAGFARQLAAVLAQRDRTDALRALDIPTTVVHGLADRLVDPSGGRALARALAGARLVEVPGMGHDLPGPILGRFADEITRTVAEGEQRLASRR